MKLCPIAVVAGCARCPVVKVCPLKTVVGDYTAPPPAAAEPKAAAPRPAQAREPAAKPARNRPRGKKNGAGGKRNVR